MLQGHSNFYPFSMVSEDYVFVFNAKECTADPIIINGYMFCGEETKKLSTVSDDK